VRMPGGVRKGFGDNVIRRNFGRLGYPTDGSIRTATPMVQRRASIFGTDQLEKARGVADLAHNARPYPQ
jgi:hypothetical protein